MQSLTSKVKSQLGIGSSKSSSSSSSSSSSRPTTQGGSTGQTGSQKQATGQVVRAGNKGDIAQNKKFGETQRQAQAKRNKDSSSGLYVNAQSKESKEQNRKFGESERQKQKGGKNGSVKESGTFESGLSKDRNLREQQLKNLGITNPALVNQTNQKMQRKLVQRQNLPNYNNFVSQGGEGSSTYITKDGREVVVQPGAKNIGTDLTTAKRQDTGVNRPLGSYQKGAGNNGMNLGYEISSNKNKVAYVDWRDNNTLKITSKGNVPSWAIEVYDNKGQLTQGSIDKIKDWDNTVEQINRNLDLEVNRDYYEQQGLYVKQGDKKSLQNNEQMRFRELGRFTVGKFDWSNRKMPLGIDNKGNAKYVTTPNWLKSEGLTSVENKQGQAQRYKSGQFMQRYVPETYTAKDGSLRITQEWADKKGYSDLGGRKALDVVSQALIIGKNKYADIRQKGIDWSDKSLTRHDSYANDIIRKIKIEGTGQRVQPKIDNREFSLKSIGTIAVVPVLKEMPSADKLEQIDKSLSSRYQDRSLFTDPSLTVKTAVSELQSDYINDFRKDPIKVTQKTAQELGLAYVTGQGIGQAQRGVGKIQVKGASKQGKIGKLGRVGKVITPNRFEQGMKAIDFVDDASLVAGAFPYSQGYQTNIRGQVFSGNLNPINWFTLDAERTKDGQRNKVGSQAWVSGMLGYQATEQPLEYTQGKGFQRTYRTPTINKSRYNIDTRPVDIKMNKTQDTNVKIINGQQGALVKYNDSYGQTNWSYLKNETGIPIESKDIIFNNKKDNKKIIYGNLDIDSETGLGKSGKILYGQSKQQAFANRRAIERQGKNILESSNLGLPSKNLKDNIQKPFERNNKGSRNISSQNKRNRFEIIEFPKQKTNDSVQDISIKQKSRHQRNKVQEQMIYDVKNYDSQDFVSEAQPMGIKRNNSKIDSVFDTNSNQKKLYKSDIKDNTRVRTPLPKDNEIKSSREVITDTPIAFESQMKTDTDSRFRNENNNSIISEQQQRIRNEHRQNSRNESRNRIRIPLKVTEEIRPDIRLRNEDEAKEDVIKTLVSRSGKQSQRRRVVKVKNWEDLVR